MSQDSSSPDPRNSDPRNPDPLTVNPYQATSDVGGGGDTDHRFVSGIVGEIAKWQTFFATMMGIAILLTFGSIVLVTLMAGGNISGSTFGSLCIGGVILIFYVVPTIMLWKAANSARSYARTGSSEQLREFAAGQRSLWRTIGILAIIGMAFYGLIFVLMMLGRVV